MQPTDRHNKATHKNKIDSDWIKWMKKNQTDEEAEFKNRNGAKKFNSKFMSGKKRQNSKLPRSSIKIDQLCFVCDVTCK